MYVIVNHILQLTLISTDEQRQRVQRRGFG